MKNKLGIVFVLGIAIGFDMTSAMEKRDSLKELDPFRIEEQKVASIISYSPANFQEPENAASKQCTDSFSKFLDELGAQKPQPRVSGKGFNAQNQDNDSDLIDLTDDTSIDSLSSVMNNQDDSSNLIELPDTVSDLIDLSDGTLTDSLSSVPELQNSKESTDSSKSSLSNSKFSITIVPAGSKPSSLGNSVKLPKQPAFNDESKGKSASIDFSDLIRKNKIEVSIKPANYPGSRGLPKQAQLAGRFKITRSPASNPGKEPNF